MASSVIKEFLVSVGFDVKDPQKFDSAMANAAKSVAIVGASITAASAALFGWANSVSKDLDKLSDLSIAAGVTASALDELGYVASLMDSSLESAASSLQGLGRVAGETMMGVGRGKAVFESLGISVQDANGKLKSTPALMEEVGTAIKDMERGQQTAVLSKLGIDHTMLQTLTSDVSGLKDEYKKLTDASGISIEQAAQDASDFQDAFTKLGRVTDILSKSLIASFLPKFTAGMDRFRKLMIEAMPAIIDTVKPFIRAIMTASTALIAIITRIFQFNKALGGIPAYIAAVAVAWKLLSKSFLMTPLGAIIAGITALAAAILLLIDDFLTWRDGGESLIPWDNWKEEIDFVIKIVSAFTNWVIETFKRFWAAVTDIFTGGTEGIKWILDTFFNGINFEKIYEGFQSVIDAVVAIFYAAFAGIQSLINAFFDSINFEKLYEGFKPVIDAVVAIFTAAFDMIGALIDKVVGKVKASVDWIKGAAGSVSDAASSVGGYVGEKASKVGNAIGSAASSASSFLGFSSRPTVPTAAPGASQTVSQNTQITVTGATDPQSTAKAISGAQSTVNADMARNLKGVAR